MTMNKCRNLQFGQFDCASVLVLLQKKDGRNSCEYDKNILINYTKQYKTIMCSLPGTMINFTIYNTVNTKFETLS